MALPQVPFPTGRYDEPPARRSRPPAYRRCRGDPAQVHRLFTTLVDEQAYPATELIVRYHQRREQELANDEIKTHPLRRPVLRSQPPEGVEEEGAGVLGAEPAA